VSGFSGSRQSYELSATRAVQDLQNPKVVALEQVDAEIGLGGGEGTASVDAGSGIYDSEAETLILKEGIHVTTTSGYEARLEQANVDLKTGNLHSDNPFELFSASGTIRGNEMRISEGGKRILFTNGVSMTLTPTADQTRALAAEAADEKAAPAPEPTP